MRRVLTSALTLAVLLAASPVFAKIGPRNIEKARRTVRIDTYLQGRNWDQVDNIDAENAPAAPVRGVNGVVMKSDFEDVAIHVQTTSLAAMPYPARLTFVTVDMDEDSGALTCTGAVVVGRDQFGVNRSETITTAITETYASAAVDASTLYAYESVSKITVTGCNGNSGAVTIDADDQLYVVVSDEIGLGQKLEKESDILSICGWGPQPSDGGMGCVAGLGQDGTALNADVIELHPYYILDRGELCDHYSTSACLSIEETDGASLVVGNRLRLTYRSPLLIP